MHRHRKKERGKTRAHELRDWEEFHVARLAHCKKKKVETMEAPQNRRFYGKMECLLLRPKSEDEMKLSIHPSVRPFIHSFTLNGDCLRWTIEFFLQSSLNLGKLHGLTI